MPALFRQVHPMLSRQHVAEILLGRSQNLRVEHRMGPQQGMAHHRKAAVARRGPLPLAQGFLGEVALYPAIAHQPRHDLRHRPALHRHEQQGHIPRRDKARYSGRAAWFKIRRARQVEAIDARKRRLHRGIVLDLVGDVFGVLLLQLVIQRLKPGIDAQPSGQTVDHVKVLDILVIHIKRSLAAGLQPIHQADLEGLQILKMRFEFGRIKAGAGGLDVLGIGQFPLASRLRDLPADIAVDRVAGQDDLGAARIVHHRVKDARVMVVKVAKA